MAQIFEKEYYLPYLSSKRKIYLIGVDFSTKTRTIESWKIEEYIR
ncbi:MAG: hypothetical protein HDS97_07335 [Bacteroidales bacterium]|nr:hypothetical protein [Bacteroidales bacterium]